MDPPAPRGNSATADQTNPNFSDKTTGTFRDSTTGTFSDQTSVTPSGVRPKIVLWGDSLTQTGYDGWVGGLSNRYQRRADVLNRGMSGYNTAWFLQLPEERIDNVALCTIWFGANDASLKEHNPHHHVSVEDYKANLKTLVEKAQKWMSNPNLLLIAPPPVDHEQRFAYQNQRYGDKATGVLERTLEHSGVYANACQSVADELKVPCLNLWEIMQEVDDWPAFLNDGLHFSPKGHDFVLEQVLKAIEKHYPQLVVTPCAITGQFCNSGSSSGLPTFGPYHDEINSDQPDVAMKQAFKDLDLATSPSSIKKPKMDAP